MPQAHDSASQERGTHCVLPGIQVRHHLLDLGGVAPNLSYQGQRHGVALRHSDALQPYSRLAQCQSSKRRSVLPMRAACSSRTFA